MAEEEHICKWDKKDYKKDLRKLQEITDPPRYACLKCGRVANKDIWLCRPTRF